MSIWPGHTDEEIIGLVHNYQRVPHGRKLDWLADQGVSRERFRKLRRTVFYGDLARGLVPRDASNMQNSSYSDNVAKYASLTEKENIKLRARNSELELMNAALGKAIGLLHHLNEQEAEENEGNEMNRFQER